MTGKKPQEQRTNEILDAAARCFARKGYDATKLDDIAAEAGITKGGIYWHFDSKREIFLSLMDRHVDEDMSFWQTHSAHFEKGGPGHMLRDMMRQVDQHMESPWIMPLFQELASEALRDEELRKKLWEKIVRALPATAVIYRSMRDKGLIRDLDFENLAVLDLSFMWGFAMLYWLSGKSLDYKAITKDSFDIWMNGIAPRESGAVSKSRKKRGDR
jgi:AcrR family transcriptional regulator